VIDSFALGSSDAPSGVLSVALFVNVENSSEILARAKRGELDAALIAVERVCGVFPLLCAATRVLAAQASGTLKTNGWSSELLYLLACNNNISVAFARFGIAPSSRAFLLAFTHADAARIDAVLALVRGERAPLEQLAALCDAASVRAHYAIADEEARVGDLESAVCNRVALFGLKQAE
jgi:hypothetical protein